MKLLDLWDDLLVPDDLVYFANDGDRLVTNPELAAWCILSEPETRVLQALARRRPRPAPATEDTDAAERALAKLVLNWLVYLPGRRPAIREPEPPLTTVYYAITDGCNLRCPYCYASSEKALPGELDTAESLDLVDQIADMKVGHLIFTGGEPMLRKDLFRIARHARDRGLAVNMITNGTVIRRPETARQIAELFNLVTVSVDGGTAEMHERTRGKGTFARTANGLRLLNEAGVVPVINHVVTPENVDLLDRLAEFVGGLDIARVRLMNHSDLGRAATDGYDFGWGEYQKILDFMWTNPLTKNLLPEGPKASKPCSIRGNCGMGGNEIYINSLGNVYPCKLVTEKQHLAGNVRRKPLAEIFAAPVLADLRRNSVYAGENLQDCRRCYIRGACGGGCRAYHMAETGDIHRNGRHLCRILRRSMIASIWESTGVPGARLKAEQETMMTPRLVLDDSVHPVHDDWKTAERRLLPLAN
ncbi:radical SAM protein with 4Fe4S-binding SPASM domain [Streptomyces sp. 1114.5]|uniref:StsB family radical SAM/SPASM domain sactipeptide maturase n=1 Tax=Streptomyces sp. 1114.5 TaxID=1938830 RepID=UPI000EAEFD5B|nr:StsB family radical SAM/SPASM domain sactipeptide maturase [Streptomyces sp. 1114.5]RKT19159.1 radical SAM protein with 4Fe4S-binding SPASM domain [Streptomyces sp. 1114.5]